MEVILIKPVRKLGTKVGEIVKVKNGFGRNFLIPQGFAVRATEANKKVIEDKKREFEARDAETKKEAVALQKKIEGKDITFIVQASADGRLFGSVGSKEIAKELGKHGHEVCASCVDIASSIKTLSVSKVPLVLHHDVVTHIIVNVARSESEAVDALREFKNPTVKKKEEEEGLFEVMEVLVEQEDIDIEVTAEGDE